MILKLLYFYFLNINSTCVSSPFVRKTPCLNWFAEYIRSKNIAKKLQTNSSITRWKVLDKLAKLENCASIYFNDWNILISKKPLMQSNPVNMWNPMKISRNIYLLQDVLHNVWKSFLNKWFPLLLFMTFNCFWINYETWFISVE